MLEGNILDKLREQEEMNIAKMVKWSKEDFVEIKSTYEEARAIVVETGDVQGEKVLSEKLVQLSKAMELSGLDFE